MTMMVMVSVLVFLERERAWATTTHARKTGGGGDGLKGASARAPRRPRQWRRRCRDPDAPGGLTRAGLFLKGGTNREGGRCFFYLLKGTCTTRALSFAPLSLFRGQKTPPACCTCGSRAPGARQHGGQVGGNTHTTTHMTTTTTARAHTHTHNCATCVFTHCTAHGRGRRRRRAAFTARAKNPKNQQ